MQGCGGKRLPEQPPDRVVHHACGLDVACGGERHQLASEPPDGGHAAFDW